MTHSTQTSFLLLQWPLCRAIGLRNTLPLGKETEKLSSHPIYSMITHLTSIVDEK